MSDLRDCRQLKDLLKTQKFQLMVLQLLDQILEAPGQT